MAWIKVIPIAEAGGLLKRQYEIRAVIMVYKNLLHHGVLIILTYHVRFRY